MNNTAYIFDAVRTPRGKGKKDGSLYEVTPVNLLVGVLHALEQRNELDTSQVDDVVMGCTAPIGEQGMDIAKTAVITAQWDESVPGVQLDRFCASGLEALNMAAMKVMSGWESIVVAGGVESMSRVPIGSQGSAMMEDPTVVLDNKFVPQGIGADLIATIEGFSREDVDNFAVGSQQKANAAQLNGYFDKSVIPVEDDIGMTILDRDELIKANTTPEILAGLRPSFEKMGSFGYDELALSKYPHVAKINHVHHAGNSSGIVDGAAALLIGNDDAEKKLGISPRAKIIATAVTGTEPTIMLTGPAPAARKALDIAGMTFEQIDLFEVNEAFASVVMRFQKETGVPFEKINVNGGAIAMGHPLGATGSMLTGTLLDELERRELRYGLCTLCVGGGMGIATIIERL